jgi:HSP20 family protein
LVSAGTASAKPVEWRGEEKKDKGYYRTERSYGRFLRTIALPEGARPDTAQATFAEGVLEITLDVNAPPSIAARRVEIGERTKNAPA